MANWTCREFAAERANQKWAGDTSYVWIREGWLYLAVILTCIHGVSSAGPSAIA